MQRRIAYWITTFVILFELLAGGLWNLFSIDWVEAQLAHLGYPDYFAYIMGVCHVAAALAIGLPGFVLLKEWAYAGIFLLWSGAVVSHLSLGDGFTSWGPPLMFLAFGVASWLLRPANRRFQQAGRPETTRREWAGSLGLVVALTAVSLVTLPAAEEFTRDWPAQRGWVEAGQDVFDLKVENTQYQALDLGAPGVSLGDMDVYSGNAIKDGRKVGHGYRDARGVVRFWDIGTPDERARAEIIR